MTKFVISHDVYMDEFPNIWLAEQDTLMGVLEYLFGPKTSFIDEGDPLPSDEEYLELCDMANGDGMVYYLVLAIEDDGSSCKIFG